MSQRHFFFGGHRVPLFGSLHEGEGPVSPLGFVFCHAWGEEKLWSHRSFVSLANALASRGHSVLRFDFTGAGDSHGQYCDTTMATHLADLDSAISTLRKYCPHVGAIGLIGCRLGAAIAARYLEDPSAAERSPELRAAPIVLVDPVTNGDSYLQSLLRSNLGAQLAAFGRVIADRHSLRERILRGGEIDIEGYEIARGFFESFSHGELIGPAPKAHPGPTLVLQLAPAADTAPRPDFAALAATYRAGAFRLVVEEPFWKETRSFYGSAPNLQASILDWLRAVSA